MGKVRLQERKRMELLMRASSIREAAMTLYQIYPKHVARAAALKAIAKAMARESYEFLLESVEAYAAASQWQDRQFIPHAATWFNQERYHDDRDCWEQPKQKSTTAAASPAYDALVGELRRIGSLEAPKYPDDAARAAVKAMGGWRAFCDWRSDQLEWRRKKFQENYHG
jgi:hypothetical protein